MEMVVEMVVARRAAAVAEVGRTGLGEGEAAKVVVAQGLEVDNLAAPMGESTAAVGWAAAAFGEEEGSAGDPRGHSSRHRG